MTPSPTSLFADLAPIHLRYAAALKGIKPSERGTPFSYATFADKDQEGFLCLAASNPEGKFYGLLTSQEKVLEAQALAESRQLNNVRFFTVAQAAALADLDYLVYADAEQPLTDTGRETLFALAQKSLRSGGLFAYRYRAYAHADETLRFLVREFAPEMSVEQAQEFLHEAKALGARYFQNHPFALAALERAIKDAVPDSFFAAYESDEAAISGTLDVMSSLLPRGFAYIGDAHFASNYLELAVPVTAQDLLLDCKDHVLYEAIKDFVLQRLERCDIWCHLPTDTTDRPAELFGSFIFGITTPEQEVPARIEGQGRSIDLTQPPFAQLIKIMTTLPMGIGDFLQHPEGKAFSPPSVLNALQILVASGIACPLRSPYEGHLSKMMDQQSWATPYNNFLNETLITDPNILLASTIVGDAIAIPVRDALVLQAIQRVGIQNSAGALLLELERLVQNPKLAAYVMDVAQPSPEMAQNMVSNVLSSSFTRWVAYGLLAA